MDQKKRQTKNEKEHAWLVERRSAEMERYREMERERQAIEKRRQNIEKVRVETGRQDSRRCGLLSIGDCFCFEEGEIEQERGGLERITERIHTKGLQFLISRSLFFGLVLESAQGCQIQEPVEKVYSTHQ